MSQAPIEPLVTAKEVGDLIHMDEADVLVLAANGTFPSYDLGSQIRFRISEIEAALQQRHRASTHIRHADSSTASGRKLTERHDLRREFWTSLLERSRSRTMLHAKIRPGIENWIAAGAGRKGLFYQYQIRNDAVYVMIYIDAGADSEPQNKQIFDSLHAQKAAIEQAFGAPLEWDRGDDKRSCSIRYTISSGGLRARDRWPDIQDQAIDAMIRLEAALREIIRKLV